MLVVTVGTFNATEATSLFLVDIDIADDDFDRSLDVFMDQPDLDEVMLRLVFENRDDFGGGVIDKLLYHDDSQCAVIVFKRPEGMAL